MPRGVPVVVGFPVESQEDRYVLRTNAFSFFIICGKHLNEEEMNILFNEAVSQDRFDMPEAIICIEGGNGRNGLVTNY